MKFYFIFVTEITFLEKNCGAKFQKYYNPLQIYPKQDRFMLSDQDIFNRYLAKKAEFTRDTEISLLGHSLFDFWENIEAKLTLKGKKVANLSVAGTSTRQYLDVITPKIQHLGFSAFLFFGVNDIVKEAQYSPKQVLDWLLQIVEKIRPLAPQCRFFLLEATPVNNISTVTNAQIIELNDYLKTNCPNEIQFIPTWQAFVGEDGNLRSELCVDGLHFSQAGYVVLRQILENYV